MTTFLGSLEFIYFALDKGAMRFGSFEVKSGRISPYFFNTGLFHDGHSVSRLGEFYANALINSNISFDVLFGPSYKGIPLVIATAAALDSSLSWPNNKTPFVFNRKEAKKHGEGGELIGAPLKGRVVIIDDVITAGTSVFESMNIVRSNGAETVAVLIALDRMERAGQEGSLLPYSAVQQIVYDCNIPVISIASLDDLLSLLRKDNRLKRYEQSITAYRAKYGIGSKSEPI